MTTKTKNSTLSQRLKDDALRIKDRIDKGELLETEAGLLTPKQVKEAGLVYEDSIWKVPCEELIEGGRKVFRVSAKFMAWKSREFSSKKAGDYNKEAMDHLIRTANFFDGQIVKE